MLLCTLSPTHPSFFHLLFQSAFLSLPLLSIFFHFTLIFPHIFRLFFFPCHFLCLPLSLHPHILLLLFSASSPVLHLIHPVPLPSCLPFSAASSFYYCLPLFFLPSSFFIPSHYVFLLIPTCFYPFPATFLFPKIVSHAFCSLSFISFPFFYLF